MPSRQATARRRPKAKGKPRGTAHTLRRLDRIWDAVQSATVERRCLTATALAAQLGVSEKTVKRGLRTLQSDLGLPLRWDPTEHTWSVDLTVPHKPMFRAY
jgi:hypothetical protein